MAKAKKSHSFPLWSIPCLLLAGGLLAADKLGAGEQLDQFFDMIAGNSSFVETALANETGALGWESVRTHTPNAVSVADLAAAEALPENMTDTDSTAEANGSTALVSESLFAPPDNVQAAVDTSNAPTETAAGAAIKELTITGESGGYNGQDGVFVQNQSGLSYDLSAMLNDPLKITKNDSVDQPTVLILHTHGSEAYVDQNGGRSEDPEHSVVHIGDVLTEVLQTQGIGVVHWRELIDVPSYNKSYNRAMEVIDEQLGAAPSIQVVIDLHRDSMITDSGMEYKVVSEIDGQTCAQLMFVMGTNAGGLNHPDWKQNLNFAVNLQKSILAEYPTLMRPVNVRKQRFNEQATTGSMILECGTSANTIQEAELSIRAFGKKLAETLQ